MRLFGSFPSVLLMLASIGLMTSCGGGGGGSTLFASPPERLTFGGAGDLGIFDPSLARDPGNGRLWMSYSSVKTSVHYPPALYWAVSIRLAFSDDDGASWQDAGVAVAAEVEAIVGPMMSSAATPAINVNSKGIWQSETSSLLYDPGAPAGQEWKLIWFQYLNAELTSYFADHSWIALKMAASPLELATAAPIKLFGGAGLQGDGANTGSPVFSPIGGNPAFQLNTDLTRFVAGANLADLNLCVFAEPGLHATVNAVYLAIFCADASTIPVTEYLVYFRCASPCVITDDLSWEYLGRLLTPADAQAATGDDHYQAPALVEKNGRTFLLVTPVDTTLGNRYNGCRVYEFISVDSRQLRRSAGNLIEVARVDGDAGTHNGACSEFAGLQGGIILSQFDAATIPETFRLYKSQVRSPE